MKKKVKSQERRRKKRKRKKTLFSRESHKFGTDEPNDPRNRKKNPNPSSIPFVEGQRNRKKEGTRKGRGDNGISSQNKKSQEKKLLTFLFHY